jgi:hypothetical protein
MTEAPLEDERTQPVDFPGILCRRCDKLIYPMGGSGRGYWLFDDGRPMLAFPYAYHYSCRSTKSTVSETSKK